MNNIYKAGLILALFVLIAPSISYASCTQKLNRTITLGMKGNDVIVIQKFLNENPTTLISKSGVNSRGKESGVFDKATVKAFKIFQTQNSETILKPFGLKVANGVVGQKGRDLINKILCSDTQTSEIVASDIDSILKDYDKKVAAMKISLNAMDKELSDTNKLLQNNKIGYLKEFELLKKKMDEASEKGLTIDSLAQKVSDQLNKDNPIDPSIKNVVVKGVMPAVPNVGDNLHVFGMNLMPNNNVYIGSKMLKATLVKDTDRFISVKIPTDIAPGEYDVFIENLKGKSNIIKVKINKSEDNFTKKPSIVEVFSINPVTGNVGTAVVLTGSKFTAKNEIHTTTKSHYNVASTDGKTLKFVIGAESGLTDSSGKLMTQLPFTIFVRNENGDSNVINFKLK